MAATPERTRTIEEEVLLSGRAHFEFYRDLGERAMSQVGEEALFHQAGPESNSIAVIVQHLRGNMLSRWTDFLTTDGEKPWRRRDEEFEEDARCRARLEEMWGEGWTALFRAVDALTPSDLSRTVTIRGEPLSVIAALHRQLTHVAYHVGQIVHLAKAEQGREWETLSVPRRGAEAGSTPESRSTPAVQSTSEPPSALEHGSPSE